MVKTSVICPAECQGTAYTVAELALVRSDTSLCQNSTRVVESFHFVEVLPDTLIK